MEKKPWRKARTNNKLNPHMALGQNQTTFFGKRQALSPLCHPCSTHWLLVLIIQCETVVWNRLFSAKKELQNKRRSLICCQFQWLWFFFFPSFLCQVFTMVQIGLGWQWIPRQVLTLQLAAVLMGEVFPCLTSECPFQWILSMTWVFFFYTSSSKLYLDVSSSS